jgi:sensor histidine kinase YesM
LLSRHARLGPTTWRTRLPIHLLGAALFVVILPIATAFVNQRLGLLEERMTDAAIRYFYTYLAYDVLIYWALVGAFHALDYLRETERSERERARMAVRLTEARLNALRSQLRPHFFFNTLNAISTFALQGKPAQVAEMVGSLGDLVRVSLDDRLGHCVPLARELEFLDLYLDIQRVRFADWLRIEMGIDPDAADVLVPSLILQPLLENAIEHGAHGDDGITSVRLDCAIEGDTLTIEIANHGPDAADGAVPASRSGVGLSNTRARLEQLYPDAHEMSFGPMPGRGFVVALRIPALRVGSDADVHGLAS